MRSSFLLASLAATLLFGCVDKLEAGTACALSSDCADPLVCRFERCRVECRESRDCDGDELCFPLPGGVGVCRLPDEGECASDADCATDLRCREGRCTTGCERHEECGAGALCQMGGCVAIPPGQDAGTPPPPDSDVPEGRVTEGLVLLYDFVDRDDDRVADVSGAGAPVDLAVRDPARVGWGDGMMTIHDPTRVVSDPGAPGLAELVERVVASNEVTVEAWITPKDMSLLGLGPGRIAVMSSGASMANFVLGQGEVETGSPATTYSLRLRTSTSQVDGQPGMSTAEGLVRSESPTHLVATRSATGESCIYVDGIPDGMACDTVLDGTLEPWIPQFGLTLGNERVEERPWRGTYDLVAIYDRALTADEVAQNRVAGPSSLPR